MMRPRVQRHVGFESRVGRRWLTFFVSGLGCGGGRGGDGYVKDGWMELAR